MDDLFDDLHTFRARLGRAQTATTRRAHLRYRPSMPGSRGGYVRAPHLRSQRVVAKVTSVKLHGAGRSKAQAHLRYLVRDGAATLDHEPQFFSADRTQPPDIDDFFERCEDDKHQFRIILSPENGHQLDLEEYTRDVMQRVEQDVASNLDWVAVVHRNTDNPHVHIVLRGKHGPDLKDDLWLHREYITHGIRHRAQEVATLDLGYRTPEDIQRAHQKEIGQNRFTSLDRSLLSAARDGVIARSQLPADSPEERLHLEQRLKHLNSLGLARQIEPGQWHLEPDLENNLKALGRRHDIIHRMHNAGRSRSDSWRFEPPSQPILARVAHRGLAHEQFDERFLIADGADGRTYYIDADQALAHAATPGAIIQIGAGAPAGEKALLSPKRLAEQVNYPGPTFLDRPDTRQFLEENTTLRSEFAQELHAQLKRRRAFLRHDLAIPFDGASPSYPALRAAELDHHLKIHARDRGLQPLRLAHGDQLKGRFVDEIELESGRYCVFVSDESKSVALVSSNRYVREAYKNRELIVLSAHEKDGNLRHFVRKSPTQTKGHER